MNDTTSYIDKLPPSLNSVLKNFAGNECVMVRKIKDKDKCHLKNKKGNCHKNVLAYIEQYGGEIISGWILNRNTAHSDRGMYVWSFHSVWQRPDGKWLDVTEDKHYIGREKSIFIQDATRKPDLIEGISHNNFLVITEPKFAAYYGNSIGHSLLVNKAYWTDTTLLRIMDIEMHNGLYRLLGPDYPHNLKKMCDEYNLEIVNGKPVPKTKSNLSDSGAVPARLVFDYSVNIRS